MSENYQALGQYTALRKQAQAAFDRRYVALANLSTELSRDADSTDPVDYARIRAAVDRAEAADRECSAAITQANQIAPLCQEREISIGLLARGRFERG